MTDRAKMLQLLAQLWEKNPHQRLGQLVANIAVAINEETFFMRDAKAESAMRTILAVGWTGLMESQSNGDPG